MPKYDTFKNPAGTEFSAVVIPSSAWANLPGVNSYNAKIVPFSATISSAGATAAVTVVPDAAVEGTQKCYLLPGWIAKVSSTVAWTTAQTVKLQDTNGTPVDFVTMTTAALTSGALVNDRVSNITSENAYVQGTGGTPGKGVQLKGDAAMTGSPLVVTGQILIV